LNYDQPSPNSASECETIGQFFSGSGGMLVVCIKVTQAGGPKKVQDQCEVKVRWRLIDGNGGSVGFVHMYVLLQPKRAARLDPYYHGAGPTNEESTPGDLLAVNGYYRLENNQNFTKRRDVTRNYLNNPEERTYEGDCEKFNRNMQDTMVRTNNAKIPYSVYGNNSNRYVYTLLQRAGILHDFQAGVESKLDSWYAPKRNWGWGESLPLP
jgi:hypothetical protein